MSVAPFTSAVCRGGEACYLPKYAAEIVLILKAAAPGDFPDGQIGTLQQLLCLLKPQPGNICVGRNTISSFEETAELPLGVTGHFRQIGDVDAAAEMPFHICCSGSQLHDAPVLFRIAELIQPGEPDAELQEAGEAIGLPALLSAVVLGDHVTDHALHCGEFLALQMQSAGEPAILQIMGCYDEQCLEAGGLADIINFA